MKLIAIGILALVAVLYGASAMVHSFERSVAIHAERAA